MLVKLKRALSIQNIAAWSMFFLLCMIFYYALLDALNKHKDAPAYVPVKPSQRMSPEDKQMKELFERSAKWSSLSMEEKIDNLLRNPVYERFRITKPVSKKNITLLVIVSSGPRRSERRQAIRESWWKQCKSTFGVTVECIFFTDNQTPSDKYYLTLKEEFERYQDIYFQPLRGGIEFGVRFLYHIVWAMSHYKFDYVLRLDDDYFFCMERFLYELPQPMKRRFHWGFTHCILEIVRPEESMILLSRDLVEIYLTQRPHFMRCHPWADQMIGVWTTDLGMNELFRHDDRLHHAPVVDQVPELRKLRNICYSNIGIHGTYPKDMALFWRHRGLPVSNITNYRERDEVLGNLLMNSEECALVHNFNYLVFEPEWQYEPQRCIYDPVWDTQKQAVIGGVYSGRQDDKRLSLQDLKIYMNQDRVDGANS